MIQPSRGAAQEFLALAKRQLVKSIGADVVPDVEIGRASEFVDVENILDGRALLARSRFRCRAIVNRVRPGVVESERKPVAHSAPQRNGKAVIGSLSRVHPRRHRTALNWEKGIATGYR